MIFLCAFCLILFTNLVRHGKGIFVFEEHVKSKFGACCACGTLIMGLIGMSFFSRPTSKGLDKVIKEKEIEKMNESSSLGDEEDNEWVRKRIQSSNDQKVAINEKGPTAISKRGPPKISSKRPPPKPEKKTDEKVPAPSSLPLTALEMESLIEKDSLKSKFASPQMKRKHVSMFEGQITLTKRQMGILASLFNGVWGGTNMIPLHFAAHGGYGGPSYVISFACGSMLVTLGLWVLRFFYEMYRLDGSIIKAYHALPSFYLKQMWLLGGMSGLLYSGGNFMCIISVTFLGQGVGYSFTQASMLVSGLWGIFCFKEIEGRGKILKWLLSASLAVTGILWLSYEHAS